MVPFKTVYLYRHRRLNSPSSILYEKDVYVHSRIIESEEQQRHCRDYGHFAQYVTLRFIAMYVVSAVFTQHGWVVGFLEWSQWSGRLPDRIIGYLPVPKLNLQDGGHRHLFGVYIYLLCHENLPTTRFQNDDISRKATDQALNCTFTLRRSQSQDW